MSLHAVLLLWLLASGVATLLLMGWAVLAALAEGTARKVAWALLVVTTLIALWPAVLNRWVGESGSPFGLPLLVGFTLILGAAIVCLDRMRRQPETRLPARLGIGAALNQWLALSVVVLMPA